MPRAFLFIACLCAMPWISQAAVSAAEQAEFLKVHNDYRRALANGQYGGPATDMQEITWDADLAAGAQAWADTCARSHDSNSARQTASNKNSYVGQNAAWGYGTIAAAAAGWWDEWKCVNYGVNGGWPIGSCSCSMCGHFTQMAWSATTKIGCGINTGCSMKTYFCNYYPGGNFDWGGRQDYVFRPGSSQCSQCQDSGGSSSQACSNGLCSNGGGSGSNPSGPSGGGPQPTPRPVAPQPTPKPTGRPTPRPVAPVPTVSSGSCPTSFYGSGYRFSWWTPLLNGNQQLVEEAWASIPYGKCFQEIKITYTPNISPGWYDKIDVRGTSGYFWGTSAMMSDLKNNMAARKKAIENYVKSRTGAAAASGQGSPPAAAASTEGCATTTTTGRSSTACSTTSEGNNNNQNKPDVGLIVGVLIGAIAVCCLVAASAYYVMRKKKMIKDEERLMSEQEPYRPPVVM